MKLTIPSYLYSISVVLFIIVSTSGCGRQVVPPPPQPDPSDILEPVSHTLTVRIFLDATLSMKGFVVPGPSTLYAQTLQRLESPAVGGWNTVALRFYKFGTQVLSLERSAFLRAAVDTDFYLDPEVFRETQIQKVIDHEDEDKEDPDSTNSNSTLTVIVTDLFQTDADVTLLVTKLKEKCVRKNLAVGILALKSQYDGIIYDVGMNADAFQYRSNENPESFRPFYLLLLGTHADIAHYFEQLKLTGLSFSEEANLMIFSRHLVNPLTSFNQLTRIHSIQNLKETRRIISSDVKNDQVKQFLIHGNPLTATFAFSSGYQALPYAISFTPTDLKIEVTAQKHPENQLVANEGAANSIEIHQMPIDTTEISLSVKLSPQSLPGKGIYVYRVVLRPRASAYQMPDWCSQWDMGTDLQNGSKTLNLNRFLTDLWQATYQIHQPKMAQFYLYFQK